MKKGVYLILLLVLGLFFQSCEKDQLTGLCIDQYLQQGNWTPYNGQNIGCKMHLMAYEYKQQNYFMVGNHCADMLANFTDCNGEELDWEKDKRLIDNIYEKGTYLGIIGFLE